MNSDTAHDEGSSIFVDRALELASLRAALETVRSGAAPRVVTIAGETGSGKSRLADRFASEAGDALVLRGRCARYVPGLGLGPLPEIVGALTDGTARETSDGLPAWARAALDDVVGRGDDPRELGEIYSAVAQLIDARTRATAVFVLHDVNRAGHGFLNLVTFLCTSDPGRPLLFVCTSDDAFAARPEWRALPGEAIDLGPLAAEDARASWMALEGPDNETARAALLAARGNPSFVRHAARLLHHDAAAEVPASLSELVAARIAALDDIDRLVLAHASVPGVEFDATALARTLPAPTEGLAGRLAGLAREGFLTATGPETYWCPEIVAESATTALPGRARAAAHEAHARALEDTTSGSAQPELVGAHLELAGRAGDAAAWFARAGHTALQRGDMPAAADLLSRSARLHAPGNAARLKALAESCDALLAIGRADLVSDVARSGREEALAAGDRCDAARFGFWTAMLGNEPASADGLGSLLNDIDNTFSDCGDELGRAQVAEAGAQMAWDEGDTARGMALMDLALVHARASGDRVTTARVVVWLLSQGLWGPEPLVAVRARCDSYGWVQEWSALVEVKRRVVAAAAAGAHGDAVQARTTMAAADALQRQLGQPPWVARVPQLAAWVDLVEGDPAAAQARVEDLFAELVGVSHPVAIETGVMLARALLAQSRDAEAEQIAARCHALLSSSGDVEAGIARGEVEAIQARAAASLGSGSARDLDAATVALPPLHWVLRRADALVDLGHAAAALGDHTRTRTLHDDAISLYETKGALACATRARKGLADLLREV